MTSHWCVRRNIYWTSGPDEGCQASGESETSSTQVQVSVNIGGVGSRRDMIRYVCVFLCGSESDRLCHRKLRHRQYGNRGR